MEPTWWDRVRGVDHRIWDAALAVALLLLGLAVFATRLRRPGEPPDAVGFALLVVAAGALAWRRRAPLAVATVVATTSAVAALLGYWPEFVPYLLIALYTAAANLDRRAFSTALVPIAALAGIAIAIGEASERGLNWVEVAFGLMLAVALPILIGRMTFNRRRRIVREREIAARDAVTAERAAVARELHDVVAHHMSVMVVQAGAARTVVGRDPAAAAEALRHVEAMGRAGLTEMRRLLDVLKADGSGDERAPQPGLAQLDDLLAGMRAAGLPVESVVEGEPRPLPAGVDLSAYRIAQEALTNSLRHAGDAHARVSLRYTPDALEVEVIDDGRGTTGGTGGGHGLVGMRERVQLFGGDLRVGPAPGGGFAVHARLPTDPADSPTAVASDAAPADADATT